jgi:peptidoglycan/xylan/chitin deacetylase (PgdA/CDA1 family)
MRARILVVLTAAGIVALGLPPGSPARRSHHHRLVGCRQIGRHGVATTNRFAGVVVRGSAAGNLAALTFDDGPNPPYTPQILAILRREHVPATFFVVGQRLTANPALVRQELADGHLVANHTWSHASVAAADSAAAREIDRASAALKRLTGFTPCLFRPPYGATSPALVKLAASRHMETVSWNVESTDWRNPGAQTIIHRVLNGARAGSIILHHDGKLDNRSQTVAALPEIIHGLRARGYHLVSLATLLGFKLQYSG